MIDLIVVGAGPSGLSCAVEAKRAGLSALVLDKGSLVDSIRRFPTNLVWFSTPDLLEIGSVPFVIPSVRPTRLDTLKYYQRVAKHHDLRIQYFDSVEEIVKGARGFRVMTSSQKVYEGRHVVLATGYFDHPTWLGVPGEDGSNVSHYYDEAFRYVGCDVAIVGGRNSAVEAALDLFRNGARVTLIHRGAALSPGIKYWVLPDIENRINAGEIKALFSSHVQEFHSSSLHVNTPDGLREIRSDFMFVLVGFRPDADHLRRFGIHLDPETLAPSHNPATFETNVQGLFVAGSVVAGKNNNKVFVENGRLHGQAIVTSILEVVNQ